MVLYAGNINNAIAGNFKQPKDLVCCHCGNKGYKEDKCWRKYSVLDHIKR